MTRTEISDIIDLATRLAAVDEPALLATLFSATGSTYRRLGSMMVGGPGGIIAGGISGGCLEEYIARHGRSIIQNVPAAVLSFDADPDSRDDTKPTLGCGGSVQVLVERFTPEHMEFLRRFSTAMMDDVASTAACIVENPSASVINARREWMDATFPGSSAADKNLDRLHRRAMLAGQSLQGAIGPSSQALLYHIPPVRRLIILGAGNDARPLCSMARSLGWHVTIADRRARLATRARFPDADEIFAADWETAIGRISFSANAAVVMMTHSLADDIEILPLLVDKPMAYVGSLGPAHRREWVLDGVAKNVCVPEAFSARFRGPIGLNLGDRTATGIAVSIIAEILAVMNMSNACPLTSSQSNGARREREMATHA